MQTRHATPKGTKSHFFSLFFCHLLLLLSAVLFVVVVFFYQIVLSQLKSAPEDVGTKSRAKDVARRASIVAWIYCLTILVCTVCASIALHYIREDEAGRDNTERPKTHVSVAKPNVSDFGRPLLLPSSEPDYRSPLPLSIKYRKKRKRTIPLKHIVDSQNQILLN